MQVASPTMPATLDLANKRVLIFIVAYNAEKTISSVLSRIPQELRTENVEVLIIDDSHPKLPNEKLLIFNHIAISIYIFSLC